MLNMFRHRLDMRSDAQEVVNRDFGAFGAHAVESYLSLAPVCLHAVIGDGPMPSQNTQASGTQSTSDGSAWDILMIVVLFPLFLPNITKW